VIENCPFCDQEVHVDHFQSGLSSYDCPRCGRFGISRTLARSPILTAEDKRWLSIYARNVPDAKVDSSNYKKAVASVQLPLAQRVQRMVTALYDLAGGVAGVEIELSQLEHAPLCWAASPEEMKAMLTELETQGFLEVRAERPKAGVIIALTAGTIMAEQERRQEEEEERQRQQSRGTLGFKPQD
jgi:hypothetical protein